MENLLKFPISRAHLVYNLVKKANKFEKIDEVLAIRFYKEAIKLLLDQRKTQDEKLRSLMSLNHVLVSKLKESRPSQKEKRLDKSLETAPNTTRRKK